jgi:hypothetical protein
MFTWGIAVQNIDRYPCELVAPAAVTAPVEGGVVSIPVAPAGSVHRGRSSTIPVC